MDSYGFQSELSLGNQHNEAITNLNRQIRLNNQMEIKKHQNDITQAKNSVANLNTGTRVAETSLEGIAGQVASRGKDFQALGKVGQALPEVAGAVARGTEKFVVGGLQAGVEGVSRQVPKLFGQTAMDTGEASTFGNLFKSDTELAKGGDLAASLRVTEAAESGEKLKDIGEFLTKNVSKGATIGEKAGSIGKLGIASTGLSVGMGLADGIEDLSAGKIVGNNTAERVSNVAGMVSGGLEAVGTALDLTGVGAPVGVALNLIGGLAGAVGTGADIVGEAEEKGEAEKKVQTIASSPAPQEKLQAVSDIASSGALVKSAN